MEFLTILLSGVLGLISPVGLVIDRTAEGAIRSQFKKAEQLQVRVDNPPTQQVLQGKVERVRIAGRSLQLKQQDIRIALLELETDPINVDARSFIQGKPKLKQPLQAGVRLVLTQQDINKALQSPELIARLRKLNINLPSSPSEDSPGYNIVNPKIEFLTNERLRFQVELQQEGNANKPLLITVETKLGVIQGRQIQLVEPVVLVNGETVPPPFVNAIASSYSKQLDLRNLEVYGLQARILKLNMRPDELEIAAFLRVEPSSKLLETRRS
jgi:hypothetical protein